MEKSYLKDNRILVVDDDCEMRRFIKEQLSARSYTVDVAASAGEAIARLMERQYDLAIMDIRMPLMDGITCLRQCLTLDPSLSIIMISGEATPQETYAALNLGAVSFMEKPLKMAILLRLIEKTLGIKMLNGMIRDYQDKPIKPDVIQVLADSVRPISWISGADVGIVLQVKPEDPPELIASTLSTPPASAVEIINQAAQPHDDSHRILRIISLNSASRIILRLKRKNSHTPFTSEDQADLDSALRMLRLMDAA